MSEIPEVFDIFGPELNTFMFVGVLLEHFRRKLLQSAGTKTVSSLGMSRFISLTKLCSAAPQYSTLNFTYK